MEKIEKMKSAFNLESNKNIEVPMQNGLDLDQNNGDVLFDKTFQSLLGGLLYVNLGTRPDISFSVNALSR